MACVEQEKAPLWEWRCTEGPSHQSTGTSQREIKLYSCNWTWKILSAFLCTSHQRENRRSKEQARLAADPHRGGSGQHAAPGGQGPVLGATHHGPRGPCSGVFCVPGTPTGPKGVSALPVPGLPAAPRGQADSPCRPGNPGVSSHHQTALTQLTRSLLLPKTPKTSANVNTPGVGFLHPNLLRGRRARRAVNSVPLTALRLYQRRFPAGAFPAAFSCRR